MGKIENYDKIRKFCLAWGADVFGVADISGLKDSFALPAQITSGLHSAVCVGARAASAVLEGIEQEPTKLYFHHYRTINMFLDQLTLRTANFIQNSGHNALPIPASQIVDWQKQTAHLSHKHIGYHAGLGWIGRNNLLVNKKLGSRFRLGTVLTDLPLKADKPVREDCGKCFACVVKCPVGAIKENPGNFDHLGCFELLKEFQRKKIVDQYICGICVRACQGKPASAGAKPI